MVDILGLRGIMGGIVTTPYMHEKWQRVLLPFKYYMSATGKQVTSLIIHILAM